VTGPDDANATGPSRERREVAITDLHGRVAVVTGGGSGIGRGIAQALSDAGAAVVVVDRDLQAAQAVAEEVGGAAHQADVTSLAEMEALAAEVSDSCRRVDVLVNNAGVGPLDDFASLSPADFHWVMDINFWGVFHGITAFLPYLRDNQDGAYIINTASMAAVLPNAGITAYGASKAAVLALSDSLRVELEADTRIGVMVLLPALVSSNITSNAAGRPGHAARGRETSEFLPPGRTIEPADVGAMVLNGLRRGATHVFTHPETSEPLQARFAELLAAYGATTGPVTRQEGEQV
jgi:NAD(P)-dependent dehydrogenase (short-subunit alcohol dehydrogenase family)